jgi:HK97 family phage major capsid protein
MSVFVPFSVELQGDATSLMQELGRLLQDGANQLLNTALTTGSGTGQPTGIVTSLVGTGSVVNSIGTDVLASGDVYAVQNALPPRFSANAQWCANLAILNTLRQFETAAGALKFPGLQQNPPVLLGRNANELSNADGVVNAGAENYVLLYGDFSNYVVTQRVGSSVELIPHLVGANRRPTGQRGVWLWGRWGADSVNDAAFRLLNVT